MSFLFDLVGTGHDLEVYGQKVCNDTRVLIQNARRYVLERDVLSVILKLSFMANAPFLSLFRALPLARLPADNVWVEFDWEDRVLAAKEIGEGLPDDAAR